MRFLLGVVSLLALCLTGYAEPESPKRTSLTWKDLRLVLAFGQSNIGEGVNTSFADLPPHAADAKVPYAVSMGIGPKDLKWGKLRGAEAGRCGALIHFLRDRYDARERNWCGISYSRGGYSLADDWLPGTALEDEHFRKIKDCFGEILYLPKGHNEPIHLELLYYHQGESDMNTALSGAQWKANFVEFVNRAHKAGITWNHMIIARPSGPYLKRPGGKTVADSISVTAAASPFVSLLDTEGIPYDETQHFDNLGQLMIGRKLSAIWKNVAPRE